MRANRFQRVTWIVLENYRATEKFINWTMPEKYHEFSFNNVFRCYFEYFDTLRPVRGGRGDLARVKSFSHGVLKDKRQTRMSHRRGQITQCKGAAGAHLLFTAPRAFVCDEWLTSTLCPNAISLYPSAVFVLKQGVLTTFPVLLLSHPSGRPKEITAVVCITFAFREMLIYIYIYT